MRVALAALAVCLAGCGSDECDSIRVVKELRMGVGDDAELVYTTDAELPGDDLVLMIPCPEGPDEAVQLSREGFGCISHTSSSRTSTGWSVAPNNRYVLQVHATLAGDYEVQGELRESGAEAAFDDPVCTVTITLRVHE